MVQIFPLRSRCKKAPFAMADHHLHVEVDGGEIVVTLPGSIYLVTYYKSPKGSYLSAKLLPAHDDPNAVMTSGEFLAQAWKRANAKARQLGWIV